MSATVNWTDPHVSAFLASLVEQSPNATASSLLPSLTAAVQSLVAQNHDEAADGLDDPLLAALPDFTYAMPVQVVILGVTITLLSMLFVHLLFTIRYHAPLNRVNYALQTSATGLSLANVAAQLHIVMNNLYGTGRSWPFMFDYIEVSFPKKSWSQAERGAWCLLQGLSALATHSTHIQFLTMLFPSALEARLILGLLGPLAVAVAGLYFTALSPSAAVNDLGDAIRNTANSSLTLLYTMALFIWGLTINRSRAWRAEGGTAGFGALALVLGVLGTAVNFVEIKEERMRWLPGVVTCILLWQSWVGFWWWVGAGMWTGEAEDVERRRDKERRKEERRAKRKREAAAKEQAAAAAAAAAGSTTGAETTAGRSTVSSLRRRFGRTDTIGTTASAAPEAIELRDLSARPAADGDLSSPPSAGAAAGTSSSTPPPRPTRSAAGAPSRSDSNSSDMSSSRPSSHHFYTPLVNLFSPFLERLRLAHDAAAVAQAAKPPGLPEDVQRGWGMRALMMRGKKERGERRMAREGRVRKGAEMDPGERRAAFELEGGARLDEEDEGQGATSGARAAREGGALGGEEWEDDASSSSSDDEATASTATTPQPRAARRTTAPTAAPTAAASTSYPPPVGAARTRAASSSSASPPAPAPVPLETGEEPAVNDWSGRGMEDQRGWWSRGLVGRWRLKDVSQW
ncbi:hypothetical protein JCM3775_005973 [Rhodotorula graminis]